MKRIYLFTFFVYAFNAFALAQNYKLLPDSAIYVHYGTSDGTSWSQNPDGWNYNLYKIDPKSTITLNNLNYIKVTSTELYPEEPTNPSTLIYELDIAYLREDSNQLFMYDPLVSQEFTAMDFNLSIGDTAFGMYTPQTGGGFSGLYDAVVTDTDSVLLSNGLYHKFMELNVFKFYTPNNPANMNTFNYDVVWSEQSVPLFTNGLNALGANGIMHSYGFNTSISGGLFQPASCLCDPLLSSFSKIHSHFGDLGCNHIGAYITNLSIDERYNQKFQVYPNLTNNIIKLKLYQSFDSSGEISVSIIDLTGRTIHTSTLNEFEKGIDVSLLLNGIYLVGIVKNGQRISTQKFSKIE